MTNGMDISLLILSEMFNIAILVLFEKYLWQSDDNMPENFDVYLVLLAQGRFAAAKPKNDYKVMAHFPKRKGKSGNTTTSHDESAGKKKMTRGILLSTLKALHLSVSDLNTSTETPSEGI